MSLLMHETPESQRPRERLRQLGASALRDSELMAILLRTGVQGVSVVDLAEGLLKHFNGVEGVAQAKVDQLARIKGVGLAKAVQLKAAFELGSRLRRGAVSAAAMDAPEQVYELLGDEMMALDHESARVVMVNAKLKLLGVEEVSRGLVDQALVHAREVFSVAIIRKAYGILLVHNHPSGDPTPSEADRRITRQMKEAATLLDMVFLDHIILGRPSPDRESPWFSFKAAGWL